MIWEPVPGAVVGRHQCRGFNSVANNLRKVSISKTNCTKWTGLERWKDIWTQNSRIYVKESDKSTVVVIDSYEALDSK